MKSSCSAAGLIILLLASAAQATTVGYWRFESDPNPNLPFPDNFFGPDFLEDSGPNDLDLTNPTVSNPTFVNPAGDAGQSPNSLAPGFSSLIPQTGASNDYHAFTLNSDQFLFRPDDPLFGFGDFTVEAMVQFGVDAVNNGKNADIASQWGGGANNAWRFLKNSGNQLSMGLSGNGFGFFTSPGFFFEAATEYYVAAVVDIESDESTNVTFYVQNLTAGTELQMIEGTTAAANIPGPLNDSTSDFVIGGAAGTNDIGATRVDEVRLSSSLLSQSMLLISGVPGDFNLDGLVDAADYTVWRDSEGALDESSLNGNGDGVNGVDSGDYALWASNYGATGAGSGTTASAVPEPSAVMLLIVAAAAFLPPWRRNQLWVNSEV